MPGVRPVLLAQLTGGLLLAACTGTVGVPGAAVQSDAGPTDGGPDGGEPADGGDAFLPWEDPPRVYAQWSHGLPADAGFFPIAVWLQSPSNAPAYEAIGINTFVGLW
ncbi:MAG TPA: hypothetical protein VK454_04710, partial [Myxococcaceae bacterium]|nr:hypothetical protein [Myxococcaceae bacterium]